MRPVRHFLFEYPIGYWHDIHLDESQPMPRKGQVLILSGSGQRAKVTTVTGGQRPDEYIATVTPF